MRLVHIADLHLGYRQFQRQTPAGINQREADVAGSFRAAVDRIIAVAPELIVVAGDVFHSVRPTNQAIVFAYVEFERLRHALPQTPVVMIAGNHDTPRSSETGSILQLFTRLGIEVVDGEPRRISFPELELSVLAVPDLLGVRQVALEPDPSARYNVLVLHGQVEGILPAGGRDDRATSEVSREELRAPSWSYVALGHYHVCHEVEPNAWYSGATDYTSSNIWAEVRAEEEQGLRGKCFLERDLATGAHTIHPLPASRVVRDLPRLDATGMSAAEVNAAIVDLVAREPGGVDNRIVRLVVDRIPRHVARELDHRFIRELKRSALNFHLDTRKPLAHRDAVSGSPGRRPTLQDIVREKLRRRPITADMNRDALVEMGMHYLEMAETAAASSGSLQPELLESYPETEGDASPGPAKAAESDQAYVPDGGVR